MSELERFLHGRREKTPTLLKSALAHLQFETIHPFLDGNGRVGRLLITLLFRVENVLLDPLLYLSLYLKRHRDEYYRLLDAVRREGDWEKWIAFFADGVSESAHGAVDTAQRLVKTAREDRERIHQLGRGAGTALRVHHALQQQPVSNSAAIVLKTGTSLPSVLKSLDSLQKVGIVTELTGRKRRRVFSYTGYVKILSEGTEPL
jgi:Fic family protein